MKLVIICIFLTLFYIPKSLSERPKRFHAFAAFGGNFQPGGSIRIGHKDWEIGKLSPPIFGVAKSFYINNVIYSQLGFGIGGYGAAKPTIHSSLGFNAKMFWLLCIRGEVWAMFNTAGVARGEGLLGVALQF